MFHCTRGVSYVLCITPPGICRSTEMNLKRNREKLDSNKVCLREHKQAHVEKR